MRKCPVSGKHSSLAMCWQMFLMKLLQPCGLSLSSCELGPIKAFYLPFVLFRFYQIREVILTAEAVVKWFEGVEQMPSSSAGSAGRVRCEDTARGVSAALRGSGLLKPNNPCCGKHEPGWEPLTTGCTGVHAIGGMRLLALSSPQAAPLTLMCHGSCESDNGVFRDGWAPSC